MKVSVAHVVNGQIAGKRDPVSLLAGEQSGSFASLLDLDLTGRDSTQEVDAGAGKQGGRSKEKDANHDAIPVHRSGEFTTSSDPVTAQTISANAVIPWQLESNESGLSPDAGKITGTPSLAETTNDVKVRPRFARPDVQSIFASGLNLRQITNESPLNITSFLNLGDEFPESGIAGQEIDVTKVVHFQNQSAMPLSVSGVSFATPATAGSSTCLVGASVSTVFAESCSGSITPEVSPRAGDAVLDHQAKSGAERENSAIGAGARVSDSSPEGNAQGALSVPSQKGVDLTSSSSTVANDRTQDGASGPHHNAPEAKQAPTDTRFPTPQKLQSDAVGFANPNTMPHGHSAVTNSNHAEPVPESASIAQFKALIPPRSGNEGAARLLGSAMRGDLRVGLQTEAFGHVTIQANAQGGQLSAQLSLENAKEGAILAAHLPGVEHKIVQQHGLTASVRLVGGFGGTGAGSTGHERSGSDRRHQGSHVSARSSQIGQNSLDESPEVGPILMETKYFSSSRLDVTV